MTCGVCCLYVYSSSLMSLVVSRQNFNFSMTRHQRDQYLLYNSSDSHFDLAADPHSLILLSQFFFPPCSFTFSASPSLVGERQPAPGRWGGGGWRRRKRAGGRQSLATERRDEASKIRERERRGEES